MPSISEAKTDDAVVRTDAEARRALKFLLGSLNGRIISTAEAEAIEQIDFLYGRPEGGGDTYRFFFGFQRLKRLCGYDLPLVFSTDQLGEMDDGPLIALAEPQAPPPPARQAETPSSDEGEEEEFGPDGLIVETVSPKERQQLELLAGGIVAFDETNNSCFYEQGVSSALEEVDRRMASRFGSLWSAIKDRSHGVVGALQSRSMLMTPADAVRRQPPERRPDSPAGQCKLAGFAIAQPLMAATNFIGVKPGLLEAASRLANGRGRPR